MAHIHEKIDFTVSILIVHGGKVLMVHHKQLDRWLPVGGHIELDENPEKAALREAREESGLDVELVGQRPPLKEEPGFLPLMTPRFIDMHVIKEPHHHIGMVYFARVKGSEVTLNEDEHHGIRWFTEEDLQEPVYALSSPLRYSALEALRALR
jgi:8-oxo-dGTP pyrophosphatase MutT (NUDIX family)